ncbi:hypothetical protein ASG17_00395 [Brevundimonas sp. Leaf363]|uniref:hypothetical protein n=1 Tax=Brevundimonas sp. Leaf363 TaxID=1736353 RepID=UPI0006F9B96F|nr:hypothetical protein [Brevundimonas sp. Leaf363]KQS57235.1 hypothetical protein ASG17_00395 [Brevundimonas sp. Leaf363]
MMALRSWPTIVLAWVSAACAGSLVVAVEFALAMAILNAATDSSGGLVGGLAGGIMLSPFAFITALPVFATGLLVVGLPAWFVMHRRGLMSGLAVPITGAALAVMGGLGFVLATALNNPELRETPALAQSFGLALLLAPPGAFAARALRRIAYGERPRPPRPSPAPAS